jgi:hypothetical protein
MYEVNGGTKTASRPKRRIVSRGQKSRETWELGAVRVSVERNGE